MSADFRKSHGNSFSTFLAILLGIVAITFGTISTSANSDDVLQTQANKTFVSQLSGTREATDYLQAIKQPVVLSAGFNPFNSREIKLSPNDFTALGELNQESLAPQAPRCSDLNFATSNFSTGINPSSVTTGDFNGDGKLDLATTNPRYNFNGNVSVQIGDGTGSFSAATSYAVGAAPFSITTGDFNGDGKIDLAAANRDSDNVSVLLGTGTGSFGAAANFAVAGNSPQSVTTGDFNGDGKLDLATANSGSRNVSVLLGNGTGSFGAAINFAAADNFPQSVTTGDFNGDGRLDLAAAGFNYYSSSVSVLLGSGTGSFGAAANFAVAGDSPHSVTTGDFNGDGRLDLATANFSSRNVSVLLGNGTGSFGAAINFPVAGNPQSVTTGDFNGDGRLDLATAKDGSSNVSVLLGNGTGSFGAAINFAAVADTSAYSITTGDFDGDGRLDLAAASYGANGALLVLLNTCAIIPYAPGDLDQSFNVRGYTTTAIGASSQANATVIQPDGKIVVAGTSSGNPGSGFALARYNSNGTLDTTFGIGGKVLTFIGNSSQAYGVALQSDGKIVVAGFLGNESNSDFLVARYNTNGTLDAAFNGDGTIGITLGVGKAKAYSVAVQTDGRIVVAGNSNNGTDDQIALVRLNANGSLDNSFDVDGIVITPITSGGSETAAAMRLQPDGKIVTGGKGRGFNSDFLIARYNTDGSLDNTFGSGGKVLADVSGTIDSATALALSADGKIIAGGTRVSSVTGIIRAEFVRFDSNGSLDLSLNGNGKIFIPDSLLNTISAIVVQPDGRIVFSGQSSGFTLLRYNFDGTLDNSFGTNGRVTTQIGDFGSGGGNIRALAIQADGYLIAAGYASVNQVSNFALARYALGNVNGSDCTYTLTPSSAAIPGGASIGSFNVSSGTGCNYTAVSNNSFITITSGSTGLGNGSVGYSINANTTGAIRMGTITAGGQTFTISQTALPSLTINNVTLNEGNGGTSAFTFTVSLLGTTSQTVTVNYATANGTATAPIDYQATSGTLSFAPGETSKTVTVSVVGDTEVEANETFTVNLTNAANATIASGVGIGTIQNDDTCSYAISPTSMDASAAGNSGNIISVTTQTGCAYTAVSNNAFITINLGANGTGNGSVSFTVDANTGAARTGTITVAGRVFTINQAAVSVATKPVLFDYDGDKKADVSVFRPSNGNWYIQNSTAGFSSVQFGIATDKIVPADYDGDGKTDIALWRENPANPDRASFYILNSSTGTLREEQFGRTGDSPLAVGDWDGDGKADPAVYRAGTGNGQSFFFYKPSTRPNVDFVSASWGIGEDKPVIADFDGDGRVDVGVFRPSNGIWYIARSGGGFSFVQFGSGEDKPVAADYDGDGKTDIAVYRPSNGTWYILQSGQGFTAAQFGNTTDLPTPADYDGDGKTDIAVYRPAGGNWYISRSALGFSSIQFGSSNDKPTPNAFVP